MDDAPLNVTVEAETGGLVTMTATGAWEYSGLVLSEIIHPTVHDETNRWFLLDLTGVTFGSEEMVGAIWQVVQPARRRNGGLVICCQGKIGQAVNVTFGGTLHVRETLVGARELLEAMRSDIEPGGCGTQPSPESPG